MTKHYIDHHTGVEATLEDDGNLTIHWPECDPECDIVEEHNHKSCILLTDLNGNPITSEYSPHNVIAKMEEEYDGVTYTTWAYSPDLNFSLTTYYDRHHSDVSAYFTRKLDVI